MTAWLLAFGFTQAVEVPVYLDAQRRSPRAAGRSLVVRVVVALLASVWTHPVVWFGFPTLPLPYVPMVALAEGFAVLVEAGWLRVCGVERPLAWSLAANGASLGLGLLSRAWLGVP